MHFCEVRHMGKTKKNNTTNRTDQTKQQTTQTLTEKEKTKEELKELGTTAVLLVDGVVETAKGLIKITTGLLKMILFALKFSLDGFRTLLAKADEKKKQNGV